MSPELTELRRNARALAFGLLWGFVVLVILSIWLPAKHPDMPRIIVVLTWALAVLSLGLAGWLFRTSLIAGPDPESRLPLLQKQKNLLGPILIGAGGLLFILGIWLGFSERLQGLADSVGMCLVALIALATGLHQRTLDRGGRLEGWQDATIKRFVSKGKPFGLGLFIGGAVLVIAAIYLRFSREAAFPVWGGALSLAFIAIGAGAWLFLSPNVNAGTTRVLILIAGGLVGLVIVVMTVGQAWLWRDEVFRGISEWRGPGGWRIWFCAYLVLFGLALMFGSFYLARADIRISPILRRVLYGYNAIFTGLLLLAILAVLNIVVYAAYPMTYRWNEVQGLYTLSESSKHTLEQLNEETTVYVLLSRRTKIFKDLQTLLDNCQGMTNKLKVDYLSPDQDFVKYSTLATLYPEIQAGVRDPSFEESLGRGVLLIYGPEPKDKPGPHAFVPARKLFKVEGGGPRGGGQTYTFVGEQVVLSELKFLMGGQKKSKIYFLQGNGEMSMKEGRAPFRGMRVDRALDDLAMEILIDKLKKENFEVRGLSFSQAKGKAKDDDAMLYLTAEKDQRKEVPKDADIVVIAGASNPVPKETLDALGRYMDKDGKLIVLTDIRTDSNLTEMKPTGLEDFLKKYNVDVTNEFVLRFPAEKEDIPVLLFAGTSHKSENLIAKKFAQEFFPFFTVRVVKPGTQSPTFKAETLLEVRGVVGETFEQTVFWAEDQVNALSNPTRHSIDLYNSNRLRDKLTQEAIPIAVAVTDNQDRPRLVVFGDAEWTSDAFLSERLRLRGIGRVGGQSFSLVLSTFNWLSKRPGVGGQPKQPSTYTLGPNTPGVRMVHLPLWLMVVVVFSLGLGVWLVRRK